MIEHGELLVTKSSKVRILLTAYPNKIRVYFADDHHEVPCNHGHHDKVFYSFRKEAGHFKHDHHHNKYLYVLTINWDVHNMRKIIWEVD